MESTLLNITIMTTELYIHCFIACLIGNLLHVLVKIRSMAKDHKDANLIFSVRQYLTDDKWALLLDVVASFALVYLVPEWLDWDSRIVGKIRSIFIFVGFTGSYIILQAFSVAKKNFRAATKYKAKGFDESTGNADAPTPVK